MMNKKITVSIIVFIVMQMVLLSSVFGANFSVVSNSVADLNPSIAYNSTDDVYLVVYEVETTAANHDIKAKIVGSNGSVLSSFAISTDSKSEFNPRVAYNSALNQYMVVWEVKRSDTIYDIYAKIINSTGALIIYPYVTRYNALETNPDVAYNTVDDQYIVTWEGQPTVGNKNIYARIFDSNGLLPAGTGTFIITIESYSESFPSVAYNPADNNYLVLWHGQEESSSYYIYGKIVTSSTSIGSLFSIGTYGSNNTNPRCAWNPSAGEYLVVMEEAYPDNSVVAVKGQRLNGSAVKQGSVFQISGPGWTKKYAYPDVAYNAFSNEYLVSYVYAPSPTNFNICSRQVASGGTLPDSETVVAYLEYNESLPAVASGAKSSTLPTNLIVWQDDRATGIQPDIWGGFAGRRSAGDNTNFNIDGQSAGVQNAAVAYNSYLKQYFVVYEHEATSANHDIYAKIVKKDGSIIGPYIIASSADTETNPRVAYNSVSREYLVVWQRYSQTSSTYSENIYARRVSSAGVVQGSETGVAIGTYNDTNPDLAYDSTSNEYFVVWEWDYPSDGTDLYGRILYASGVIKTTTAVALATEDYPESSPSVTYNPTNTNYLVLWHGKPPVQPPPYNFQTFFTIYGTTVTNSGSLVDQVAFGTWGSNNFNPRSAWNPSAGEYLVVMEEAYPDNSVAAVKGQRLNGSAVKQGSIFKISGTGLTNKYAYPDVAYNASINEFLVTYVFKSSVDPDPLDLDIYCRQVAAGGTFPGYELMVSANQSNETAPSVASGVITSGDFPTNLIVWQDDAGPDIYGGFAGKPVAGTGLVSNPGIYNATLYGQALPNGRFTSCYFEYGQTTAYGNTTATQYIGSGTDILDINHYISGLLSNTTYHYRLVAENDTGKSIGNDQSLHTDDADPTVITEPASFSATNATFNGTINPNGTDTDYFFQYGVDTPEKNAGSGRDNVAVYQIVIQLSPNTPYSFRLVGRRGTPGNYQYYYGDYLHFTTDPLKPNVYTHPPINESWQVTFKGAVNPNNTETEYHFEWGPDQNNITGRSPASANDDPSAGSGSYSIAVDYVQAFNPGTSGVYRLVANNIGGTSFGGFQNFSTPPVVPGVITTGSSLEQPHSARVHGRINPGGDATTWQFCYQADGAPAGLCTNPPGNIVAGNGVVNVYADLTGLAINTKYYFYLRATNSVGTITGLTYNFTTPSIAPTVVTLSADQRTSDSAVLHGNVVPNETETDYWFKYWVTTDGESTGILTGEDSAGSGTTIFPVSVPIKTLLPDTQYSFRLYARNAWGEKSGDLRSFKTELEYYVPYGMWPNTLRPWYFEEPSGIVSDNDGNVYVADTKKHRIQKYTSNGHFLTSLGGEEGSAPGEFNRPRGLATDADGNLFVADEYNNRVQKFDSDGNFKTILDCPVGWPFSLAVTMEGKVYVCTQGISGSYIQIFKENDDGSGDYEYEGDLGDGGGSGIGQFNFSKGSITGGDIKIRNGCVIQIDPVTYESRLVCKPVFYVADYGNDRVQVFESGKNPVVWTVPAPSEQPPDQPVAQPFNGPNGIAVPLFGNVRVLDWGNKNIKVFNLYGEYIEKFPGPSDTNVKIVDPKKISIDKTGSVYLVDAEGYAVQKFSSQGEFVSKWANNSDLPGEFDNPEAISLDRFGNIYVADTRNQRIQKFDENMVFIKQWYKDGNTTTPVDWTPMDIAISDDDRIYVVGPNNTQIFDLDGNHDQEWITGPQPGGIAVDAGYAYITDIQLDKVYKYNRWVNGTLVDSWDATNPTSITIDALNKLYVTQAGHISIIPLIIKMETDGTVITQWGSLGSVEGTFGFDMKGITVGSDGFVYGVDSNNHRVQKFTVEGDYVNQFGVYGVTPGKFDIPTSIKMNADGTKLYVVDSRNHRVQVFDRRSQGTNEKAIILAGGGNQPDNKLWKATKVSADLAYWVLGYQGFDPDDIYYLSAEEEQDTNPYAKNITKATLSNFIAAIDNLPSQTSGLTIYLTDHGGKDGELGTFQINENEVLDTGQLNSMIQGLGFPVTLIVDACYSGRFASKVNPAGGIVISSSGENEVAQFASQGWLSFSAAFWMNIFGGSSVQEAFSSAETRIQNIFPDQNPDISDDTTPAGPVHIGNGIPGKDAPTVGSPGVTSSGNSAIVHASGLPDTSELSRVWAVVIPPFSGLQLRGKPILDFPIVDMAWSTSNTRWEGEYKNFSHKGDYKFKIYFMDNQGRTSIPLEFTDSIEGSADQRKAAIVVGGNADPQDLNWQVFKASAEQAYQTLKWQGYHDDNIEILSPGALAGVNRTLNPATGGGLQAVINLLEPGAKDLVLYIIGPGGSGSFRGINGEEILAVDISGWLGTQLKTAVIYDADLSGSFISELSAANRIIVTSTGRFEKTRFISADDPSFSKSFWNQVFNGNDVFTSYLKARTEIGYTTGQGQTPELDDDGDGICCELDEGNIAKEFIIGNGIRMAPNTPTAESAGVDAITGNSARIWADNVTATGTVVEVWAMITPPGYMEIPESLKFGLGETSPGSLDYEGICPYFENFGPYKIAIFARDSNGEVSKVKESSIVRSDGPDIYEPDDTDDDARLIFTQGSGQTHNFHDTGSPGIYDEDWIKFYANHDESNAFTVFEIESDAASPGASWSPVIALFDSQGNVEISPTPVSGTLNWNCDADGMYYIRVTQSDPSAFGVNSEYDISVYRPIGDHEGVFEGFVYDQNWKEIGGADVKVVYGNSSDTGPTLNSGYFSMTGLITGDWSVKVVAQGYDHDQENITISKSTPMKILRVTDAVPAKLGDIDGDNDVDLDDANLVNAVLTGQNPVGIRSEYWTSGADVNGDLRIGPEELIYILSIIP